MRMFIAIPLPRYIEDMVCKVQGELEGRCAGGRFVPMGNHHITLHFFGEENDLSSICDAMHEAVRDAKPFLLKLSDVGFFRHGSTSTGFLNLTGQTAELFRIYDLLEAALLDRGFVRGKTKLHPHITLGRALSSEDVSGIEVVKEGFIVNSIVLYESLLSWGEPSYMPLHMEIF
ncbi:MAG: RNA 2',3'-cyclic phosphodiesterase [Clostridia bacterium]|nr:RNA 2',3'-cyclic phosphodiesterase [Clostridia bacterium]